MYKTGNKRTKYVLPFQVMDKEVESVYSENLIIKKGKDRGLSNYVRNLLNLIDRRDLLLPLERLKP